MKLLLTTTLMIFLLGGFTNVDHNSDLNKINIGNETFENQILVKGMLVDGEVFPSIELPEITITAKRNAEHLVRAEIINGEIVPVIDLEEVVIYPNS